MRSLPKVSEVQLSYKNKVKAADRIKITSSLTAYETLLGTWDKGALEYQEHFKVLLLNNSNHVLGAHLISTGGMTGTLVDVRMLFTAALKAGATSIILAHNHPSGGLNPSGADKSLTQKIKKAGETLDIKTLDHLIITPDNYYSFADEGIM